MSAEQYTADHPLVQMIMVLKLQELQKQLPSLRYENLEDFLNDEVWKNQVPLYLSTAADDILHIDAAEIIRWLSNQAVKKGKGEKLEDFSDLLGGQ